MCYKMVENNQLGSVWGYERFIMAFNSKTDIVEWRKDHLGQRERSPFRREQIHHEYYAVTWYVFSSYLERLKSFYQIRNFRLFQE